MNPELQSVTITPAKNGYVLTAHRQLDPRNMAHPQPAETHVFHTFTDIDTFLTNEGWASTIDK
jgi:hypothetical protein